MIYPNFTYANIYQHIQQNIHQYLPSSLSGNYTSILIDAMKYSVMNGGKRIRAVLVYTGALCMCASMPSLNFNQRNILENGDILKIACALELIHAYSLVHDDLPCMDNDDMRRGKPTLHKVYNEALALLAGDALQTYVFQLLSELQHIPNIAKIIHKVAYASGAMGMAGGQAIDILSETTTQQKKICIQELERMHLLKTGALIDASFSIGFLVLDDAQCTFYNQHQQIIQQLTYAMGLGFQVVDDILDSTQSSETLGKTAGKDAKQHKCSYISILGLEQAKQHAQILHQKALQALNFMPENNVPSLLYEIIDLIFKRTN